MDFVGLIKDARKQRRKKDKMTMIRQGINWFLPEILIIRGSWNLTEPEAHLGTPKQ